MIRFSTARMSQCTSLHSPAPALLALAFSLLATPFVQIVSADLDAFESTNPGATAFVEQAKEELVKLQAKNNNMQPGSYDNLILYLQLAQDALGLDSSVDDNLAKAFARARADRLAAEANAAKASAAESGDSAPETSEDEVEYASFSVGRLNVHVDTGLQVLNPFTVSSKVFDEGTPSETRLLIADTSERDFQGFTQISVNNRFAWQQRAGWQRTQNKAGEVVKTTAFTPKSFVNRLGNVDPDVKGVLNWLDFDLRLGVTYGQDQDSAQQIAESGQLFASFTTGLHLFSLWRSESAEFRPTSLQDEGFYWSGLYLDGHVAVFTDSTNGDIHHRAGVGPAFLLGMLEKDKDVPLQVMFRALFASVEALEGIGFRDDEIIVQSVNGEGFVPEYKSQFAVSLEAEVRYPFGNDLSALVGGRVDAFIDPNPWVLYIGASIPLSKFQSFFSGD